MMNHIRWYLFRDVYCELSWGLVVCLYRDKLKNITSDCLALPGFVYYAGFVVFTRITEWIGTDNKKLKNSNVLSNRFYIISLYLTKGAMLKKPKNKQTKKPSLEHSTNKKVRWKEIIVSRLDTKEISLTGSVIHKQGCVEVHHFVKHEIVEGILLHRHY